LGRTALFEHYFDEVKKVLIESGADVNARDRNGHTPLDSAGSEEAALMLLAAGAQLPSNPAGLQEWAEYARKQKWTQVLTLIEPRLEQAQHHE
jgi:ankyrin repeat protein